MIKEKIAKFLDKVLKEDYLKLDEQLKDIVYTKVAIKVDQEVNKLRQED
jgi:hypothetical protein